MITIDKMNLEESGDYGEIFADMDGENISFEITDGQASSVKMEQRPDESIEDFQDRETEVLSFDSPEALDKFIKDEISNSDIQLTNINLENRDEISFSFELVDSNIDYEFEGSCNTRFYRNDIVPEIYYPDIFISAMDKDTKEAFEKSVKDCINDELESLNITDLYVDDYSYEKAESTGIIYLSGEARGNISNAEISAEFNTKNNSLKFIGRCNSAAEETLYDNVKDYAIGVKQNLEIKNAKRTLDEYGIDHKANKDIDR